MPKLYSLGISLLIRGVAKFVQIILKYFYTDNVNVGRNKCHYHILNPQS